MKKGQAAMEYILMIGFILALLIPLILLFYNQRADTALQVRSQQLRAVGEKIVDQAESVYYLGEPSRIQFRIQLPDNVVNVTIVNKALVFKLSTEAGVSDIVIPSVVNITGAVPLTSGIHHISVENRGGYVNINSS